MTIYPTIEKLVLASGSPRRRELLQGLGLAFDIRVPTIDETPLAGESPPAYAERLAREKAAAVTVEPDTTVLAADTIVAHEGHLLGKPNDENEALAMLTMLSGRTHQVVTGMALVRHEKERVMHCSTDVVFRALSEAEMRAYIATGCPMDKAGAYAIQGGAAHMVRAINGSYTNVVGLPLCELHELLISF